MADKLFGLFTTEGMRRRELQQQQAEQLQQQNSILQSALFPPETSPALPPQEASRMQSLLSLPTEQMLAGSTAIMGRPGQVEAEQAAAQRALFERERADYREAVEIERLEEQRQQAVLKTIKDQQELTEQFALMGYDNPQQLATAVQPIRTAVRALDAADDIMSAMRMVDGTFQFPTEQKGAVRFRMASLRRFLMEFQNTGVLTPGEMEYLDGLLTDPTKLSSSAKWEPEQIGEFKAFMRTVQDFLEDQKIQKPMLATQYPEAFRRQGNSRNTTLPDGFEPGLPEEYQDNPLDLSDNAFRGEIQR